MIPLIGVISGILMLVASNLPTWLKPILINNHFPDWVYNDFGLYVSIYLLATAFNSWMLSKFSDNTGLSKKIALQKKEHRSVLKKTRAELEEQHNTLKKQKDGVIRTLKDEIRKLQKDIEVKKEQIKRYTGDLHAEMERCCSLETQLKTRSYNKADSFEAVQNSPTNEYLTISGRNEGK